MSISRVGQIAVTVSDMTAAKRFFVDSLGLPLLFDAGPGLSFVDGGNVRLMLSLPEGGAAVGNNSCVYFVVDDLDAAYKAALEKGAVGADGPHLIAKMPDHELWMAFLRDPDGNLVGLMEERR